MDAAGLGSGHGGSSHQSWVWSSLKVYSWAAEINSSGWEKGSF